MGLGVKYKAVEHFWWLLRSSGAILWSKSMAQVSYLHQFEYFAACSVGTFEI